MLRLAVASTRHGVKNGDVIDPVLRGKRIRDLRIKLGMTQAQLAEKADVTENTVRGLEKGTLETRRPKYEAIVEALDTTTELIERADQPIAEDHPLLSGLNDQDLQIAQAYSRARTPTRLRIERLLLTNEQDPVLAIGERVLTLDDKRREQILGALSQAERMRAKELEDAKKKKPPPAT